MSLPDGVARPSTIRAERADVHVPKITTFLAFDDRAEEAATFYVSISCPNPGGKRRVRGVVCLHRPVQPVVGLFP
jgi:hypothetical protein